MNAGVICDVMFCRLVNISDVSKDRAVFIFAVKHSIGEVLDCLTVKVKELRFFLKSVNIYQSVRRNVSKIQCDSFGTRHKKMRISQRLFIRFWACIYDYTLLHEKHVDTCLPLSDILTSSGQRLASGAMSRTAVSFRCAVVKENGVHNRGACIHRS